MLPLERLACFSTKLANRGAALRGVGVRFSQSTQRGAAFLTLVAIVAAISLLFVIGQASWQSRQRLNELPRVRAERVDQAAAALRDWYRINAREIDSPAFLVPTGPELLAAAGVPRQWGLEAGMTTTQLVRDQIRYRVLAVWAPSDDDTQVPIFNAITGELVLCPDAGDYCGTRAAARVEGFDIQAELYATTMRSLRSLAAAAQAYFHGKWLADPDHNLSVNYFRSCVAARSELPCLDSWTDLSTTTLLLALQEPQSRAFDAWGGEVQALNGEDNDDNPPYRLAFRAQTPWGIPIVIYALQRL